MTTQEWEVVHRAVVAALAMIVAGVMIWIAIWFAADRRHERYKMMRAKARVRRARIRGRAVLLAARRINVN